MAEPDASLRVTDTGRDAGGSPAGWAADVVSADGRTVRLRPIRPDDDESVLRLYERLSPESMYLRFFRRSRLKRPVGPSS